MAEKEADFIMSLRKKFKSLCNFFLSGPGGDHRRRHFFKAQILAIYAAKLLPARAFSKPFRFFLAFFGNFF